MRKSLALTIGLRYTGARKSNRFVSFISLVSMLGIALGSIVLITVMSVMNGFEAELRERILGMVPHIIIRERDQRLDNWQQLARKVEQHPHVIATAPFIDEQAMFRNGAYTQFGLLQGIEPLEESKVSIIDDFMLAGSLDDLKAGQFQIVLGVGLARSLGVGLGDKVTVLIADGASVSPAGITPRYKRFTVVGLFEVRAEADSALAYTHIKDAAKLSKMNDSVAGLRITTDEVMRAQLTAYELRLDLPDDYFVSDWNYSHGTLFHAIKMEKTMMFVLLLFIVAVAAFNIVSTLVMVVTEKQADIAILRTLGASPGTVMRIFMIQGTLNGVIGVVIGVVGGVLLSWYLPAIITWIEQAFGTQILTQGVYFINFLPSKLMWADVAKVGLSAFGLSVFATLYPAWRASRINPAEALRYE
jgi:lipoprotein-releasing system permease protein